jgi:arylsulfatase A-like enzyme
MLPAVLSKGNVRTATISSFGRHPAPWFYMGWGEIMDPSLINNNHQQSTLGEKVNELAIPWLERNKDKDFFLHLHYWDPHTPPNVPIKYHDRIYYAPDTDHLSEEEIEQNPIIDSMYSIRNRSELEDAIRGYDAEILYVDELIGKIVDCLLREGIYNDTVIILSSDHGELWGEWGLRDHPTVHDSVIRVPLIIKIKMPEDKITRNVENNDFVYTLDIAPTLTDAFGIEPDETWNGISFLPKGYGFNKTCLEQKNKREYVVCDNGMHLAQRAIRDNKWKLVITYTYNSEKFEFAKYQLYDVKNDPWEKNDVATDHPEIVNEFKRREMHWLEKYSDNGRDFLQRGAEQGLFTGWNPHSE